MPDTDNTGISDEVIVELKKPKRKSKKPKSSEANQSNTDKEGESDARD